MEEGRLLKGAQAVATRNEKQQGEIQQALLEKIKKLGEYFYRYYNSETKTQSIQGWKELL